MFSCKKSDSDSTLLKNNSSTPESSTVESFPKLTNLTPAESDSLKRMLRNYKTKRADLVAYANSILKPESSNNSFKAGNNYRVNDLNDPTGDSGNFDESETTSSMEFSPMYYESNAEFDGITDWDDELYYNPYGPSFYLDVPKFYMKHTTGGTLPGRGVFVTVEVPIEYRFRFNQLPPYNSYYYINTMSYQYTSTRKPKMYLSEYLAN